MNNNLLEFLAAFQSKLDTLFPVNLKAKELVQAVAEGKLSLISTNSEISVDDYENLAYEIDLSIKSFHSINRNPRRFLKSEEVVRPVELSKNINDRTIYELSKNSHNWKRKRIASVEPTHLLTEVNEDDFKLYENKVYKTLLDRSYKNLHYFSMELKKMINDKRSAVQIDKGYECGYKGAKLFRKIAPNNIDNLNSLDEIQLLKSLMYIEDVTKKIQLLQRGNLYYNLRKENPVKSPLNKTNILMKDKNYFKVWDLWNKIDEEEYRRGELAQENEYILKVPKKMYITYVFINLVVVLLNDGYNIIDNNLGNYRKGTLKFTAKDDYTRLMIEINDSIINGKMSEIGSISINITNDEQLEFLNKFCFNDEMKFENNLLTVKKKVKKSTVITLNNEFSKFLDKYKKDFDKPGGARVKQKVFKEKRYFNENVIDKLNKFINNSQSIDFNIQVLTDELPGTNMELQEVITELREKKKSLLIYPGIDKIDGIEISDRNSYLLNTLGENLNISLGEQVVKDYGNFKFQMFELAPKNLSCINRISRFFNIMKYKFESYKNSLDEYCPSCGEKAVNKKNETDYQCHSCRSIWSYSTCANCNHDYLYLRLEDDKYMSKDEFDNLLSYLNYLEIYRGTLALTNIDIDNEFKTLCPKCGHS